MEVRLSLLYRIPENIMRLAEEAEDRSLGKVGYRRSLLCPPKGLIYKAFSEISGDPKVVILGQDPYHTPGKARGVAFGYHEDYKGPTDSSLANILKEANSTTGRSLKDWTRQGVLLLNTRLTTSPGQPMAHAGLGWEEFTEAILQWLSTTYPGLIFMLWGKEAQSFDYAIQSELIFRTSHPCKYSAHRGFIGSGQFEETNKVLRVHGKEEIKW